MDKEIRVFISYAWESLEFKEAVWQFAGWLERNGGGRIKIILDKLYENRPPVKGWLVWMQEEIRKADVVLAICSPKYKERFLKEDDRDLNGGFGAAFEGAIITQEFYVGNGLNSKFFPILPDKGDTNDIPPILQAYSNGHTFPAKNINILKLILNDNPTLTGLKIESTVDTGKIIEFEKEMVKEITPMASDNESFTLTPIQITVRAFLSLNGPNKLLVANSLGITNDEFKRLALHERDKKMFHEVKEKNLLFELWEAINKIKPFENPNNPFQIK